MAVCLSSCGSQEQLTLHEMFSDNGEVSVRLDLVQGRLSYEVSFQGETLIKNATLGIIREDSNLSERLSIVSDSEAEVLSQDYSMATGKISRISDRGKSYKYIFQNQEGSKLGLEYEIYNSGFAFRYFFPGSDGKTVTINKDLTTFSFSLQGQAWMQPYDQASKWGPAYESDFKSYFNLYQKSPTSAGWSFPALFKFKNDAWLLVSDAGIDGDYVGTHLQYDSIRNVYAMRWPEQGECYGFNGNLPIGNLPWQTSWKVYALADGLNGIVNNNIVTHVSPESRIADCTWIIPGFSSWSWLADQNSPKDYHALKKYVDLAADMNWTYSLVDANWNEMINGDLAKLASYAKSQDVGLFVWYNSAGVHNDVMEKPRDIISDPKRRKNEFRKLNQLGVKGVKIDFFQSDKQFIMELYKEILMDAAEYQLMVNLHGCSIPRGWSRTYPNLVSMESVRGAESYIFDKDYPKKTLTNNTILPFTRNVIGSMDYTPVVFNHNTYPHLTTYGHELALAVVFESGIMHMGGSIEGYGAIPPFARAFLSEIPSSWDEIKYLIGTPGQDVVLARRKGKQWFIGGINGENQPKKWTLDLSSLKGNHNWEVIADGMSENTFSHKSNQSSLQIDILPYGGFVARTQPY